MMRLSDVLGRLSYSKASEATREAAHAVYALQSQGLGPGQGTEPRAQAVGDRQDHRADVARPT